MKKTITQFIGKNLFLLPMMLCTTLTSFAQVSVTSTSGATGTSNYPTVNAAFAGINAGLHQGAITITVTSSTIEPINPTQLLSSGVGASSYSSITLVPQGNVTINSANTPIGGRGILEFIGADFITIDGDDPLTAGIRNLTIAVAQSSNGLTACLRFGSATATGNGCRHVTVKNCNLIGSKSVSTSNIFTFCIFSGGNNSATSISTSGTSGAADNDTMLIENNTFTRAYFGIYCSGLPGYTQDYLRIRNNTIGSSSSAINNISYRGIYVDNTQSSTSANSLLIEGNDIQAGEPVNGITDNIAGMEISAENAGAIIRANNIHNIHNPNSGVFGAYGILLSFSNTNIRIYNNFIRDITAQHFFSSPSPFTNYGIYSNSELTALQIIHNTIVLNEPNAGTFSGNYSACLFLGNNNTTISELRNNIFVNNQSDNVGQACLAVALNSAGALSGAIAADKNNYWTSGVSGYIGSTNGNYHQTLALWRAATLKDSNSFNFSPTFVSSTDLHLVNGPSNPFESSGDITSIITDIDGQTRPGPSGSIFGGGIAPDLGADEADMGLPTAPILATGIASNITLNTATLSGSIIYNGGRSVIASGIVLSTSPSPVRGGIGVIDSATNPLVNSGALAVNISGLTLGTTYHYRTYAINAIGTAYGPDSTFTTNSTAVTPSVNNIAPTGVTGFSAITGGDITSDGGSAITASGIVYSTAPNPTIGALGVTANTTNPLATFGTFSILLSGLNHSTKYYYRAFATNAVGTSYSIEDSFTTDLVIVNLPYAENFDASLTPWTTSGINGGTNSWVRGTPSKAFLNGAFSTPNAFVTRLVGSYLGTEDCVLTSPQMDFSNQIANPVLRFKHKMDVDADINWDGGVVEISINGGAWIRLDPQQGTGANFNTVNSMAWYNNSSPFGSLGSPKWSVNTGTTYPSAANGWITSVTQLTGAAGQNDVRVRFRFWADGGVDEGWAIDDIEVFAPSIPTVQTGTSNFVTNASVTLNGVIIGNGGATITTSGFVLSTTPNPVRGGQGVIEVTTSPLVTSSSFASQINALNAASTYYYRSFAANAVGTAYGVDSTFTTLGAAIAPSVITNGKSNVGSISATVSGIILSDGGSPVTASGIVYATNNQPSLSIGSFNITTTPLVNNGAFTLNITGLSNGTMYYFRAYAINNIGTSYGTLDSFFTQPIINLLPYADNFDSIYTPFTSSSTLNGGANDWIVGTPSKILLNGAFSGTNAWVTKTTGYYSNALNAFVLSPQFDLSTYTTDPVLIFKHNFNFVPSVDGGVVEISFNGGNTWTQLDNIVGTGGNYNTASSISWYNFNGPSFWSPSLGNNFSGSSNNYSSQNNGWIESKVRLTGAAGQANVRFRFRMESTTFTFFGTLDGWAIDNIQVVLPTVPSVKTGTSSNKTNNSVTLSGNISSNGNSAITTSGIVVGTTPSPVRLGTGVIDSATSPLVNSGPYSLNINGLSPGVTYYYRAYAINALGIAYGPDSSFTTNLSATPPTITANPATNILARSANVSANIPSNGGSAITANGVVYSSINNLPAQNGIGVIDSGTVPVVNTGSFNVNIAGLQHSTKYYYRAYASNIAGTSYSAVDSFVTSPIISAFPYTENFDGPSTPWSSTSIGSGTNSWVLGTPVKNNILGPYSTPNAFVTRLTGNYLGSEDCAVVSPQFDFSALTNDPVLRFRHIMDVDNDLDWDGGVIEISINGGTWIRVDSLQGNGNNFNTTNSYAWYNSNVNNGTLGFAKFSANTGSTYSSQTSGWIESATRLSGAAGQADVRIRFRFWADGLVDEGWAIDNIEVVAINVPTIASSNVAVTPSNNAATINFTPGNGNGRLVVARNTSTAPIAPTDSILYFSDNLFGAGSNTGPGNFVVYNGQGVSVNVNGLAITSNYTFDVYEYNGKYMHNKYAAAANASTTTTPVKLISFNGVQNNTNAQLYWVTASEINNKGFYIEHSIDGIHFEQIGFVNGKGNSNRQVKYKFTDNKVFENYPKAYYRLQQIDVDGQKTYSNIILISITANLTNLVNAYPNPFTRELFVNITTTQDEVITLELVDLTGKLIGTQQILITQGTNNLPLEIAQDIPAGAYVLRVNTLNGARFVKVFKQ